jgi:hypothetical protein
MAQTCGLNDQALSRIYSTENSEEPYFDLVFGLDEQIVQPHMSGSGDKHE